MIEYKVIQKNHLFKCNRKAIETAVNKLAKEGWRVTSISFTSYYGAYATLERDLNKKAFA